MPKIIEAVYENGVFKPLQKVDLREGEKVRISVKPKADELKGKYGSKVPLAELIDEIYDRRSHFSR